MRAAAVALCAVVMLGAVRAAPTDTPHLSDRDRADLDGIEAYLNGVHTLQARFIQVSDSGQVAGGQAFLARPGRLRFQYDPPAAIQMVANGNILIFYDGATHETSNIPLSATPLGWLLRDYVTLSGDVTVTRVERDLGVIRATLRQTDRPEDGALILAFSEGPLTLSQWTVIDAQAHRTTVTLQNVQTGLKLKDDLFVFEDPDADERQRLR